MKVGARSFDRLNSLRRPVLAALLATSAAISVQGCLPLMVGGTVMGSVAATDRRTIGAQADDAAIVLKARVVRTRSPATWVGSLSPASIIAYC